MVGKPRADFLRGDYSLTSNHGSCNSVVCTRDTVLFSDISSLQNRKPLTLNSLLFLNQRWLSMVSQCLMGFQRSTGFVEISVYEAD